MITLSNAIDQLRKPNRPETLVAVTGYLLFQEMRIDPANLHWNRGDRLLYSTCFKDTVLHGFKLMGCSESSLPEGGFSSLQDILNQTGSPSRLFCLVSAMDSEQISRHASADGMSRAVVICDRPPEPAEGWTVLRIDHVTPESLARILRRDRDIPYPCWIVAPLTDPLVSTNINKSSEVRFAQRMKRIGTETAFDVLAQVKRLEAEGRDIISFGLGEPDFHTPHHVKEAAKQALDDNQTHYTPSAGIAELRSAIAETVQRTRGIPVSPEEVVVAPGAKPILFDAMMALIDPGDEVLYPNPGYPIYESVIDWIGGTSVPLPLHESKQWNFSIDDLVQRISPRTKMIVLNTPGNPTGTLLGEKELREIARVAVEHNVWVIADEVYSQIVFDGQFFSVAVFPGMKERTIIVDGFSKTYAMTGWRLGYGVMNRDLAAQLANIETNIDSCTCAFTQIAGIHALRGPQDESRRMVQQFKERCGVIVNGLNEIEGMHCLSAQGAFYVFPNVTQACRRLGMKNANELQQALLEHAGVAVLPRTCFGRKNEGEDQEYIRLSFATSMDNIQEGLRRMKRFIEQ